MEKFSNVTEDRLPRIPRLGKESSQPGKGDIIKGSFLDVFPLRSPRVGDTLSLLKKIFKFSQNSLIFCIKILEFLEFFY